jgi:hypothetical protein
MSRSLFRALILLLGCLAIEAHAEPYLAVQTGFRCQQCHINPTGGGMRNAFGDVFAQTQLPAQHLDTGTDTWAGNLSRFLSIGGDLRFNGTYTEVPHTSSTDEFDLDQARLYVNATVIPDRLSVYVDELLAPGGALNREAYVLYWGASHTWYVKAGQLYLPYGLRLEDQTAFIRTVPGINMDTPDKGVEFGWEKGPWDAQFAVSNGTAGASEVDHGKQYSAQLYHVQSVWRLGAAANYNDAAAGAKSSYGIFGGVRTGPIAWLAEADLIDDKSIPNDGGVLRPQPRRLQRPAHALEPGLRIHPDPVPAIAGRHPLQRWHPPAGKRAHADLFRPAARVLLGGRGRERPSPAAMPYPQNRERAARY